MSRPSVAQRDKQVTVRCGECGRVIEVFERLPRAGDGALLAVARWRPRHVDVRRSSTPRPTRPADRAELDPDVVAALGVLGVWPYHCHRDCGRDVLVPVSDDWLDEQVDGAVVEV